LLGLLALCAVGCTPLRDATRMAPAGAGPDRQVLVMLRMTTVPHYQPGPNSLPSYMGGTGHAIRLRAGSAIAEQYNLRVVSEWPMPVLGVHCFVMEVPQGTTLRRAVARLSNDERVEWAQPMQLFRVLGHTDPYYALQSSARLLRLDEMHRLATGKGVSVAQIDSGVDIAHPDLVGQLSAVQNFVDDHPYRAERHGTAVAGVIVAKADNGVGIVGVAPDASLMPLRACWETADAATLCSSYTLAKALQFALRHGARIVNLSLAGPADELLARLIDRAIVQGVTVVAAVDPERADGGFPASHPRVIAAVALNATPSVVAHALRAPGEDVLTTVPESSWGFASGASIAAAHVTGVVALLLERSPDLRPASIAALLSPVGQAGGGPREVGVLDPCAAIATLQGGNHCTCCDPPGGSGPAARLARPPS
jgi:Subtilase family